MKGWIGAAAALSLLALVLPGRAAADPVCTPGSFLSGGSCVAAPAGPYVATAGATSATPCAAGTYQPTAGQTSCLAAAPGSYVSQAGMTTASPCPAGTYSGAPAAQTCAPAPPGTY